MYTAAAEAGGKVGIPRCVRDFQAQWKSRFWTFPLCVFSTAYRAPIFSPWWTPCRSTYFAIVTPPRNVWRPVAADVNAESVFAVMVAPVRPGAPSRRSSVRDNGSPACHFPIAALQPGPALERDDNYPVQSARIDRHSAPPNHCSACAPAPGRRSPPAGADWVWHDENLLRKLPPGCNVGCAPASKSRLRTDWLLHSSRCSYAAVS